MSWTTAPARTSPSRWARFAGPNPVEAIGYSFGDTENVNADGEVTGIQTVRTKVDDYLAQCEAQGLGRPKILP